MTIVNHTHRFIYVHIPKTAGTAVKHHLLRYSAAGDLCIRERQDALQSGHDQLNKHSTSEQIREMIGANTFDSYFKFTIVRNPFLRVVSTFRFLKYSFRNWQKASIMDEFETLENFVSSQFFWRSGPGRIFEPQAYWVRESNRRCCTNFVGRTESLEADIAIILETLKLTKPDIAMGRRNQSKGVPSIVEAELAAGTIIDAIRLRYAEDFELFGYPTEPEAMLVTF